MVKRRDKKNKSGTHGHGSSKKNRNAGNRGGREKAGRGKKAKHEKMTKEGVHELGEHGFTPYTSTEQDGINLRDIDERIETFVEEGLAEETDDGYIFYADKAGYEKILGRGKITKNIKVKAENFSDSAKRKLQENDLIKETEE
ncbi:MAG: uL15m family ribosomal protein [Candidatus Nanohaloarchaea archaeon]